MKSLVIQHWLTLVAVASLLSACNPDPLPIPTGGLSIKIHQRGAYTVTTTPVRFNIEIGDITGGQTLLQVIEGEEGLIRQSVTPGQSVAFVRGNVEYELTCEKLDNYLIGDDVGYFNLHVKGEQMATSSIEKRVAELLELIRKSDAVFIRNGSEYSSTEAADHLKSKFDHARVDIKSFHQFIDDAASKSSSSGEDYRVRLKDGRELTAREWYQQICPPEWWNE